MQKIENLVSEANELRSKYGGRWHVVKIGSVLYTVHDSWLKKKGHHDAILFSHPEEKIVSRKLSVVRRIIVRFNTFLLLLFKKQLNVKGNKGSS